MSKYSHTINIAIDVDLMEKIDADREVEKITRPAIVNKALKFYYENRKAKVA